MIFTNWKYIITKEKRDQDVRDGCKPIHRGIDGSTTI
jgi:hypothetical protein